MNTAILNTSRLNHSVLNTSRLNTSGLGGGKASGGVVQPDEYVLNNAVLLKNGKPLLLADGTPLVLFPKSEEPELDASLVDAWIFSGYRNEDAPATIAGVNGIELTCYNFAWNEEGSGFKDGALWFDGVDDYLVTTETIIAKEDRFTIICKRNIHTTSNHNAIISNNASWTNNHPKFAFELRYNGAYVIANGKETLIEEGFPEIISWMTDSSYNGIPIDNVSDILNYHKGMVLGAGQIDWVRGSVDMNIYYFAIYRSALTEPEIQSEIAKLEAMWNKRLNNN